MKLLIVVLAFLFFIVSACLLWVDSKEAKSDSLFLESYIHTKAFCNETNYCQDYKIECQGNQATRISPVTGAFLQQSENWQDPRDEETKKILCK